MNDRNELQQMIFSLMADIEKAQKAGDKKQEAFLMSLLQDAQNRMAAM